MLKKMKARTEIAHAALVLCLKFWVLDLVVLMPFQCSFMCLCSIAGMRQRELCCSFLVE